MCLRLPVPALPGQHPAARSSPARTRAPPPPPPHLAAAPHQRPSRPPAPLPHAPRPRPLVEDTLAPTRPRACARTARPLVHRCFASPARRLRRVRRRGGRANPGGGWHVAVVGAARWCGAAVMARAHARARVHTYAYAYPHVRVMRATCTRSACMQICAYVGVHTCARMHAAMFYRHARVHTHTYACRHACMRTHARTHTRDRAQHQGQVHAHNSTQHSSNRTCPWAPQSRCSANWRLPTARAPPATCSPPRSSRAELPRRCVCVCVCVCVSVCLCESV